MNARKIFSRTGFSINFRTSGLNSSSSFGAIDELPLMHWTEYSILTVASWLFVLSFGSKPLTPFSGAMYELPLMYLMEDSMFKIVPYLSVSSFGSQPVLSSSRVVLKLPLMYQTVKSMFKVVYFLFVLSLS